MKGFNFVGVLVLFFVLVASSVFGASLNGSSSIYSFNVSNCLASESVVGCNESYILFSCDVSNKQFVDFVEFRIDNSLFNASFVGYNARYNFLKSENVVTVNESIVFDRIYITDTNGDTAVFDEDVSVLNDCVVCMDVGYLGVCDINDSGVLFHIFEPEGCDVDYNESVSCDYCEEDLVQVLGDCLVNNSQSVSYYDNNYFSCCAVSGLESDCSILSYPYNVTTFQNCSYLVKDFSCSIPSFSELNPKMPFSCFLPDNNVYNCIVNVYEDGRLLQVNPETKNVVSGLLTFKGELVEDREFFSTSNGILNAYFSDKNLVTDKDFLVEVVCSDGSSVLKSQNFVNPFYDTGSRVVNRLVWVKDNASYMLVAGFLVLLLVLFVGWSFSKIHGR